MLAMEEMSPLVAVTLCENPGVSNGEITQLKLVNKTASLLSSSSSVLLGDNSCASWDDDCNLTLSKENECTPSSILRLNIDDGETTQVDDNDQIGHNAQEGAKETCLVTDTELLPFDPISDISATVDAAWKKSKHVKTERDEHGRIFLKVIALEERNIRRKLSEDAQKIHVKLNEECPMVKESVVALDFHSKQDRSKDGPKSVFELDCVPLWGSASIRGHRPEMEDALMVVPHFMEIPIKMFIGDGIYGIRPTLTHLNSHFFGVYDGHGGSEVANYCRDRIHSALAEELVNHKQHLANESSVQTRQAQWEKVFTDCFLRVDDEVSGKSSETISKFDEKTYDDRSAEPIAPETVGSTAVVAVVCSSHIVVSNCGDSRAVLYRGKESIALSVDHKPSREDECARIESAGGKVIRWDGHRVCGVLAMSRAIGDRYLKPWVIPEPEVTVLPRAREDECLIIASDGLWDVMTNEEVCEVARKRILMWHKKNGTSPLIDRGQSVDPAANAAAEYLAGLAIQKGSKDNISVIVVDLKARRKIKNNKS